MMKNSVNLKACRREHDRLPWRCVLAFFLMSVMMFAMIPAPVQAATVKITPTSKTMYVGESATIRTKGSYKKAVWKSNNSKVVSVSKKGVVKAKKAGTAKITVTFTLKNKKTVKRSCTIQAVSAGKVIPVADADDAVVQEIVGCLTQNTPFSLLVKGSKEEAAAVVASLQEKAGKVNEYGVLFQYRDVIAYNDGWLFRMTKDRCELYNYSVSFFKQIHRQTENRIFWGVMDNNENLIHSGEEQIAFVQTFDTWEAYDAIADDALLAPMTDGTPENIKAENRRIWTFANYKFCDLSQAMKVWVVSRSAYFSGMGADLHLDGRIGMVYGDGDDVNTVSTWNKSDLQQMKLMAEDRAAGACGGIAQCEVTAFTQLGIEVVYLGNEIHACSMVYPYNADGQKLTYKFEYGIRGNDWSGEENCSSTDLIY